VSERASRRPREILGGGINELIEENRTRCLMSGAKKCEPRNAMHAGPMRAKN
jgi:hypothetical protein